MWLFKSSIGRKVIMATTGAALVLFLTFHALMNVVSLFSAVAYNAICEFLGANWYAVVATVVLAILVLLHFVLAFHLVIWNLQARGPQPYAIKASYDDVEWSSQNMFSLGTVVILGLALHLYNFWNNMMFAELVGNVGPISPTDGYSFICITFSNPVFAVLYIIWLAAIWFHLSHGFWSAMQTFGWNGKIWFCRWKVIGIAYVTLLMLSFVVVVLAFLTGLAPSLACADSFCTCPMQ
mgnify:CR=1 FL=1